MLEPPRQVYVVKNESIEFVCPECAFSKLINVERFLQADKGNQVKIRCKCYNIHSVILDRRNGLRKLTDIQGRYFFTPQNRPITDGAISIKDLSYAGLGFNLLRASSDTLGPGDVVHVQFKIFPHASFLFKKEVVIKQMNDLRISATFQEPLKNENDLLLKLFFYTH